MSVNKQVVLDRLSQVMDSETGKDVVSLDMISGVTVKDGKAGFLITIDPKDKDKKAILRTRCEEAVLSLDGISSVTAVLTAQNMEPIAPAPKSGYSEPRVRAQWNLTPLDNVKKVIVIASGKGGVGKSTTAVNLALALRRKGKNVGLLDADIYGASIPQMLALSGQPDVVDNMMVPLERYGIKTNSMGYISGSQAAILRAPMINKTLYQLLRLTRWGTKNDPLDILLVDMPPGTGDIHLSMAQQVPVDGAIIVTTPQDVAVIDADKCAQMFVKTGIKLLGVVENMSYFLDSNGSKVNIFGEGGGQKLAEKFSATLLGSVPLDTDLRVASDNGDEYGGVCKENYDKIADLLINTI
ncbi:MAG: Mrp/NBP35 family ATP-binding protein [Rickettsiales bacterium]